ncbi:MAG TPA: sigma-70 family RNA polymerase sigma factor [Anaerolineales bacterium]|nr:sigma-70 family RNA polymerase sigma factor [Anaerolineales bacterium]
MYPEEPELLRLAQAGVPEAFDRLVERLTPGLYRMIRRMMPDRAEAEAVVQETWLRAWKARRGLEPSRPAFPWLARIAANAARDYWRKRRPIDFADVESQADDLADVAAGPELRLEMDEARRRMAALVENLRPEWRMILALRYDGNLSYKEIADALSVPLNTVRTHLRRALLALRSALEADDA